MRNSIINESSKLFDIVGALTGTWYEYDRNGWHIVKTPFMLSMTGSFDAGPVALPVIPTRYGNAVWSNGTSGGVILVKPKQATVILPQKAFVYVTIHGIENKL